MAIAILKYFACFIFVIFISLHLASQTMQLGTGTHKLIIFTLINKT